MPVFMFESAKSVPQQSIAPPTLASEATLTGGGTNGQTIPFPTSGVFLPGANPLAWDTLTIEIDGAQQAARGAGPTTHATPNGTWTIPAGAAPTITFVPSGTFAGAIAARLRIADSAGRVSPWKPVTVTKAGARPAAPTAVTVTAAVPNVRVDWATQVAAPAVSGHTVQMRFDGGEWISYPALADARSAVVGPVASDGLIEARVAATNTSGTSDWSPVAVLDRRATLVVQDMQVTAPFAKPVTVPMSAGIVSGTPDWRTLELRDPDGQSLFASAAYFDEKNEMSWALLSRNVHTVGQWWLSKVPASGPPDVSFMPLAGYSGTTDVEYRVASTTGQMSPWATVRVTIQPSTAPQIVTWVWNNGALNAGINQLAGPIGRYFDALLAGSQPIEIRVDYLTAAEWIAAYGAENLESALAYGGPDTFWSNPATTRTGTVTLNGHFWDASLSPVSGNELSRIANVLFHEVCHVIGLVLKSSPAVGPWVDDSRFPQVSYWSNSRLTSAYRAMTGDTVAAVASHAGHWQSFDYRTDTALWDWADGIHYAARGLDVHEVISPISAEFLRMLGYRVNDAVLVPFVKQLKYWYLTDPIAQPSSANDKAAYWYAPEKAPPGQVGGGWGQCLSCIQDNPVDGPSINRNFRFGDADGNHLLTVPVGVTVDVDVSQWWVAGSSAINLARLHVVPTAGPAVVSGGVLASASGNLRVDLTETQSRRIIRFRRLAAGDELLAVVVFDDAGLVSDRIELWIV